MQQSRRRLPLFSIALFSALFSAALLLSAACAGPPAVSAQASEPQQNQLVRPSRSAGCSQDTPAVPPSRVEVDGLIRSFITVVPPEYDPDIPQKLVFAFHGRTSPNEEVRQYYDLEPHATNTIFIYPSGLAQGDGTFTWSDPGDPADALRDYAFFDAMLGLHAQYYCLNLDEVYAVGHSLGAYFANALGCARGSQVRGVGTLGGSITAGDCVAPTAAIVFHNPNDRLVDIDLGVEVANHFLRQNNITTESVPAEPRSLNCERYGEANERHPVVWCPHTQDYGYNGRYYPHNWPDETGRAIVGFFESLP